MSSVPRAIPIHMKTLLTSKDLSQDLLPEKIAAKLVRGHSAFILAVAFAAILQDRGAANDEFVPVLLIALQRLFDHVESSVGGKNLLHLHLLSFELLVVLEEASQHQQAMAGKVAGFEILAEFGGVGSHRDDFVIGRAGGDHGHDARCAGFDECKRL